MRVAVFGEFASALGRPLVLLRTRASCAASGLPGPPGGASELRPRLLEVGVEGLEGRTAERHESLLAALAEHAQPAGASIQGVLGNGHELAHAQPGAVEHLEHRAVAQPERIRARRGLDQRGGLLGPQYLRQRTIEPGTREPFGRILAERPGMVVEAACRLGMGEPDRARALLDELPPDDPDACEIRSRL